MQILVLQMGRLADDVVIDANQAGRYMLERVGIAQKIVDNKAKSAVASASANKAQGPSPTSKRRAELIPMNGTETHTIPTAPSKEDMLAY